MTYYQNAIREDLAAIGRIGVDPRHVEGYMRSEHGTLDHLDRRQFRAEVRLCVHVIDVAGASEAEEVAQSFGL